MSSVPLVRSLSDPRNLATLSLYLLLGHLAYRALTSSSQHESSVIALRFASLLPSLSSLFILNLLFTLLHPQPWPLGPPLHPGHQLALPRRLRGGRARPLPPLHGLLPPCGLWL